MIKYYIDSVNTEEKYYYIIIEVIDVESKYIKFYIDKKTYSNLGDVLKNFKPFRQTIDYKYQIAGHGFLIENPEIIIEAQSGKKRLKVKAKVSEFFIQNLTWVYDNSNSDDLKKYYIDKINSQESN